MSIFKINSDGEFGGLINVGEYNPINGVVPGPIFFKDDSVYTCALRCVPRNNGAIASPIGSLIVKTKDLSDVVWSKRIEFVPTGSSAILLYNTMVLLWMITVMYSLLQLLTLSQVHRRKDFVWSKLTKMGLLLGKKTDSRNRNRYILADLSA